MLSSITSKIASLSLGALLVFSITACEQKSPTLFDLNKGGALAEDFSLPSIDNKTIKLSDYNGQLVLVNFWASWCPPCRFEIPDFIKLQTKYQEKGFTFIGIGVEELKPIKAYSDEIGINYPITHNEELALKVASAYGNPDGALPYSILISRDQKILEIFPGLLTPTKLSAAIEKHL